MKPKKLNWKQIDKYSWIAKTPIGEFGVELLLVYKASGPNNFCIFRDKEEETKQACQDHFDSIIEQCIE